jgi:TatA/E family protein of Tat protein translocase
MFGTLGGPELLLILVIALIVFGPRKLPEMGRSLGKVMLEFRRASNEFKRTVEDEVDAEQARERAQAAARPPAATLAAPPAGDAPAASAAETSAEAAPAPVPAEPPLAPPPGTVALGDADGGEPRA